jgi:two-component system chemotaxis response regulator CheY
MSIPASLKAKHFLVVDDYESMRAMVSEELRKLGVTKITFASSGSEAVSKISQLDSTDPVQYVLSDLVMENGNGIELTSQIRQKLNKKNLPILMITSKAEIAYVLEAVKAGVNNYIVKPWEEEEFIKKLIESDRN